MGTLSCHLAFGLVFNSVHVTQYGRFRINWRLMFATHRLSLTKHIDIRLAIECRCRKLIERKYSPAEQNVRQLLVSLDIAEGFNAAKIGLNLRSNYV